MPPPPHKIKVLLQGWKDITPLLLEPGGPRRRQPPALHVCVQKGYREMLEVLLRAGADTDTQTRDGQQQTAVMLLDNMRVPGREDMRRLLISAEYQ